MATIDRPRSWRKSSYSNDQGECVEISNDLGALRDSKNPSGPRLEFTTNALMRLTQAVKAGTIA